jgi:CrcB protein
MVEKIKQHIKRQFYDSHPELPLDPDVQQPGAYRWPPHFTPVFLVIIGIGGCLGTVARYEISQYVGTGASGWPIATLCTNLLGAFSLGLLLEALARRGPDEGMRRAMRLAIGTGFMGAFTTYSTLAVETDLLVRNSQLGMAAVYAATTLLGGVICSMFGIQLAAVHHKRRGRQ